MTPVNHLGGALLRPLGFAAILGICLLLTPHTAERATGGIGPAEPPQESWRPPREGFFREVLFARRTLRTPLFHAAGDDHVDTAELIRLVPAYARANGLTLRGLVALCPSGEAWESRVFAF